MGFHDQVGKVLSMLPDTSGYGIGVQISIKVNSLFLILIIYLFIVKNVKETDHFNKKQE